MDVRFLKEISEAYTIDTELNISPDIIFNELYDTVKYVRQYDPDLYNELYEVDRIYQQRILKNYLDLCYENELAAKSGEEVLEEVILEVTAGKIIAIISVILAGIYRKGISKAIFKTLSVIGKALAAIGEFISTRGKYLQLRYAIIQENANKCYIKCGISDPKKISALSYLTITTKSSFGTKQSLEQSKCLRECYIENLIEVINLHMESYFACLKRTGNFSAIQKTDADDIMRMISSTSLGTSCLDHYELAKNAMDSFYKILDLVYNDQFDEDRKLEWINKLRTRLYDAREQIHKMDNNNLQRYDGGNKPQFQNNKPQFQNNKPQFQGNKPPFRR